LHQVNSTSIPEILHRFGQSFGFWLTEGRRPVQEWNAVMGKEAIRFVTLRAANPESTR
jgi:hypothetical protein